MNLVRPLRNPATYMGWVWLIVGGALTMPYMLLGEVAYGITLGPHELDQLQFLDPRIFLAIQPLVFLSSLVLPVRGLARAIARSLLRVNVAGSDEFTSWSTRWRTALWNWLHLCVGAVMAGVTLALIPFAVAITILPFSSDPDQVDSVFVNSGWHNPWGVVVGPLLLLALVYLIAGVVSVMRGIAPFALGPSTSDRLKLAEDKSRQLAARNQLARELHDSVGHALSVITVQSEAATRLVDRDPAAATRAMEASGNAARSALEELDDVLGVLRGGASAPQGPQRTLSDWPTLVAASGVEVDVEVEGQLEDLPPPVSREAFRIVQESLTNVIRHGDGLQADMEIHRSDDWLKITVTNVVGSVQSEQSRTGSGLTGMRERALVLGGTVTVDVKDGLWRVVGRLPVKGTQ